MILKEYLMSFKFNKILWLIHFAGLKSVSDSVKNPIDYWDGNVNGTINLLKIMKNIIVKILFLVVALRFIRRKLINC